MDIIYALMKENVRLTYGRRWLIFDETTEEWEVYAHRERGRTSDRLISTPLQHEAVKILLDEER